MLFKIRSNFSSSKPSSKISPKLRYFGLAPTIKTSLIEPQTQSLPILTSSSKKIGLKTKESVLKAKFPKIAASLFAFKISLSKILKSLVKSSFISSPPPPWAKEIFFIHSPLSIYNTPHKHPRQKPYNFL